MSKGWACYLLGPCAEHGDRCRDDEREVGCSALIDRQCVEPLQLALDEAAAGIELDAPSAHSTMSKQALDSPKLRGEMQEATSSPALDAAHFYRPYPLLAQAAGEG